MVRRPPQIGGHRHKNIWAGVDYLKPTPNLEGYSWCVQELVLLQGGKGTFRNSKDSGRGKVEPWVWHSCKDSVPSGLGLQFWINPQKDFHWFTKTPFFDPKLHFWSSVFSSNKEGFGEIQCVENIFSLENNLTFQVFFLKGLDWNSNFLKVLRTKISDYEVFIHENLPIFESIVVHFYKTTKNFL